MKPKIILIQLALILLVTGLISSCTQESDLDSSSTDNFTTETADNLATIDSDFVPDSMSYDDNTTSSSLTSASSNVVSLASDDDPCANTDLFGCQPRLLKLYLKMSKEMFRGARQFMRAIGRHLGKLKKGASGIVTEDDGTTIHYSKVSARQCDVLAITPEGAFFDVSINERVYTLKIDMANDPDSDDDFAKIEIIVDYSNRSNWKVTSTISNNQCNADDVRAPGQIRMIVSKTAGIHTGKAMLYSPLWAFFNPDPTCASTTDDDHSMMLYTDFVAKRAAAKVKVYMMKRNISDLSSMDSLYPMNKMCDHYWSNFNLSGTIDDATDCYNTFATYWDQPLTAYPNPFCTTGPNNATWGSDCDGINDTIRDSSFGPTSDWTVPSTFYQQTITLRNNLD